MINRRLFKTQGFKNSAWTLLGAAFYPAAVVVATPFFINLLGAEQFGIWILINTTLQLFTVLNLGLGDSIIKFISQYSASSDYKNINKIVNTCLFLTIGVAVVVTCGGLVASSFIEANNLFEVSEENIALLGRSLDIAITIFVLKFFDITLLAVFQGFHRYDISSRFSLLSRTLILVGNFIGVLLGLGLEGMLVITFFVQGFFVFIEIVAIKKMFPLISLRPIADVTTIKNVLSFGLWSWLQSLLAMVTIQIDKIIVGYFSGVEVLSYYSLGSMLAIQLHTIFLSVSGWIFPAVSLKKESAEPLTTFYFNANTLLLIFGLSTIVGILLFREPLMTLWLGPEVYGKSMEYIELFLFYNLFLLPLIMPYFFLNGSGYVKHNTASELILKTSNILLMASFYSFLGNTGLVWGLIVSTALNVPLKIMLLKKYALREKIHWLELQNLIPGSSIILFFMSDNLIIKLAAFLLTIFSFYFVSFRPSSIPSLLKKPLT